MAAVTFLRGDLWREESERYGNGKKKGKEKRGWGYVKGSSRTGGTTIKKIPGKKPPGRKNPRKNGPWKKNPHEKRSAEIQSSKKLSSVTEKAPKKCSLLKE